jgi:hypothetical protein
VKNSDAAFEQSLQDGLSAAEAGGTAICSRDARLASSILSIDSGTSRSHTQLAIEPA